MNRVVVVAASMAGILYATRLKRRLPADEINLVLPGNLEQLKEPLGPVGERIFQHLPNLELLVTRDIGILEAKGITTDFDRQEVVLASSRGRLPIRFTKLVVEVQATARVPRSAQKAENVFAFPIEGFAAEPQSCDRALLQAATGSQPVIVVGAGMSALDAALLALEAGAHVVWIYPQADGEPWLEPHMWQYLRQFMADRLTLIEVPEVSVQDIQFVFSEGGSQVEAVALPDGQRFEGSCVLWTSMLMARHPILREDGFFLDERGRVVCKAEAEAPVQLIGNGAALPSAVLKKAGCALPPYIGGEESAFAGSAAAVAALVGSAEEYEGLYGVRRVQSGNLTVCRAGLTVADGLQMGLPVEHATVSMPFEHNEDKESTLVLTLVCHKKSMTLLGVQVAGIGVPGAVVDGIFSGAFTAFADETSLQKLAMRESVGLPGRALSRCASMLVNKCAGKIKGITPDELLASAKAGAEFFMLDLRSTTDWEQGSLKGAYNIPFPQLKKRLQDEVPRFTPLVLICHDSSDAYVAGCRLVGLGATDIYILDGGMCLWPYSLEKGSF